MAFHIREETKDPDVAPTQLLEHWINTNSGDHWIATGTGSVSDWEKQGAGRKHAEDVSIPGGGGTVDVNHGLGTQDILTEFWRKDTEEGVYPDWTFKDGDKQNTIQVTWDFQLTMRAVIQA